MNEFIDGVERVAGLPSESIYNALLVMLGVGLLILARAYYNKSQAVSTKEQSEARAFTVAINNLSDTIQRQNKREDKTDTLLETMADTDIKTSKALADLTNVVREFGNALEVLKPMSKNIEQTHPKLDNIQETVKVIRDIVKELKDQLNERFEITDQYIKALENRIKELEDESHA